MNQPNQRIENLIHPYIENLSIQLQMFLEQSNYSGRIQRGEWSNDNGLVVGFVSYYPTQDPIEKSIDAIISLSEDTDSHTKFEADICWSDGNIIAEIDQNKLDIADLDTIESMFNQFCSQALEKLLPQMIEIISSYENSK